MNVTLSIMSTKRLTTYDMMMIHWIVSHNSYNMYNMFIDILIINKNTLLKSSYTNIDSTVVITYKSKCNRGGQTC